MICCKFAWDDGIADLEGAAAGVGPASGGCQQIRAAGAPLVAPQVVASAQLVVSSRSKSDRNEHLFCDDASNCCCHPSVIIPEQLVSGNGYDYVCTRSAYLMLRKS